MTNDDIIRIVMGGLLAFAGYATKAGFDRVNNILERHNDKIETNEKDIIRTNISIIALTNIEKKLDRLESSVREFRDEEKLTNKELNKRNVEFREAIRDVKRDILDLRKIVARLQDRTI
jgi:predicted ABC-class ATPase